MFQAKTNGGSSNYLSVLTVIMNPFNREYFARNMILYTFLMYKLCPSVNQTKANLGHFFFLQLPVTVRPGGLWL